MLSNPSKNKLFFLFQAILFINVLFTNGCVFVPLIDGVKKLGVTSSDRQKLLEPRVSKFQELVYWNKLQEAGAFINPEMRSAKLKELNHKVKGFRLVDSKVEFIEFDEESYKANVEIIIRRFKVPFYVVEEFKEQQKWEFSVSTGWMFVDSAPISNNIVSSSTGN